jgi:hypothetical protein
LGFAGHWLFGDWFGWHGKKTSALIEAEATRKNHRHPTGVRLNATLDLETQFWASEVVTSYTRWLEWSKRGGAENPEVYLTFSPIFERIWLEAKKRLP